MMTKKTQTAFEILGELMMAMKIFHSPQLQQRAAECWQFF